MYYIDCFIAFSNSYFRPILILISSVFAIFFASKKIGNNITVNYSISYEGFSAGSIKELVLSNKKDKPVSIFSIYALFENDLALEVKKLSPPVILKPYETVSIFPDKYSELSVDGDEFNDMLNNIKFVIDSADGLIPCKKSIKKESMSHYRTITKNTYLYNGFVYNESVRFILDYVFEGDKKTAFITKSGYIGNEWGFFSQSLRFA
ncbi:hypothetical protein DS885_11040 [Psychromonas sp. B3M02]|uniref:hypothetical protein n=1 Tax=Psychromonas sp. B3M02 TaxID=2267226 RepID=UPI000DFC0583|nr:hypothetical protein [Psychromonas sp. B3M02]RBW44592.1 hypothetical protein DS885_11040 [Psychromonas sp. B3M02]